ERIEVDQSIDIAVTVAFYMCLNYHRGAWPFRSGRNIQSVQTLNKFAVLFCFRDQVHRARGQINRWRPGDSDLRNNVAAIDIPTRYRCDAVLRVNEPPMP